jgi:predicted RNA-binding protein YlqC (UPF0109 family)
MHEQDEDLAPGGVADGAGDEIEEVGAFSRAGAPGADEDEDDDLDEDEDDGGGDDEDDDDDEDDEDDEDGDEEELSLGVALGRLVGLLVDQPEDIHILEEVDAKGDTVFTVQVAPDDLGKLIGRQGRTARSLRNFLEVRGQLDGKSYSLEIREQP